MLEVDLLSKAYTSRGGSESHATTILDDISFKLTAGDFLTVIGPSGCGKSTLLACIAGLIPYDSGSVNVAGQKVTGPREGCAVVFQQASLLPWRTVLRNVEYGLELGRIEKRERRLRAKNALQLVGLDNYESHFPHELSGGMQQRVNLARALALEPELLLMDEPFGALDALTRERLQDEVAALSGASRRTTVFITHDVEEAVYLGDWILVMSASPGRIRELVRVPLPRPRLRDFMAQPDVQALLAELRSMLRSKPGQ